MNTTLPIPAEQVTILAFGINEADNIRVTFPHVQPDWARHRIYVDGNSADGSAELAESLGWTAIRETRRGIRYAYTQAFTAIQTPYVLIFSPDGNTPAEAIPRLLAKLGEGYDLVIGSRYLDEGKSDDDTHLSLAGNFIFTRLINLLFGGRYTDAMTNFRVFRTSLYTDLQLQDSLRYGIFEKLSGLSNGALGVEPLFAARAAFNRLKIAEIQTREPARLHGEAKFPKYRGGLGYLLQLLYERVSPYRMTAKTGLAANRVTPAHG